MARIIDLSEYRSGTSRVFAGRDRGTSVRERARIDDLDRGGEEVEVRIPPDTFSVNSSFFLGMFEKSIQLLGPDAFRQRYHFIGADVIKRTLEDGIAEALRTKSPL